MSEQLANKAKTTLASSMDNSQTTASVTSAAPFPTTGDFRILVKAEGGNTDELMTVTGVSGTTFTVTRASEAIAGAQSASAHGSGAEVIHVLTAGALVNLNRAGGNLLKTLIYAPGSLQTKSTSSSTLADIDATNLAITFSLGTASDVLVTATCWVDASVSGQQGRLSIREGSNDIGTPVIVTRDAENGYLVHVEFPISSVSAGTHTYKLAFATDTGTLRLLIQDGANDTWPPVVMTVSAVGQAFGTAGAWNDFTPTLTATTTNPTLGTGGSVSGRYVEQGRMVIGRGVVLFGSSGTNAGSGNYEIALPVSLNSNANQILGTALLYDDSAARFYNASLYGGGSSSSVARIVTGESTPLIVTHASPVPWAANDAIQFSLFYEASTGPGYGSGYPEGNVFPPNPTTNDKFYRNDLDMLFKYDGTRWLCTCLHSLNFNAPGSNFASDGTIARCAIYVGSMSDLWLTSAAFSSFASATNDGSNYWTLEIGKYTAGNVKTTVASRTTSGDTQSNWTRAEVSINALLGGVSTYKQFQTLCSITAGSPGPIYPAIELFYRFVAT